MMKMKMLVICAGCAAALTGCQPGVQTAVVPDRIVVEDAADQTITVSAKESVKVVPDVAQVTYGITTQNQDASACQEENGKKMGQLMETLKAMGVEEKSIQTSNQSLRPQQDWENNGKIVGYEMSVQVTVSDIAIEQVGQMLTTSVTAGVNEIQGVSFFSSKYDESYEAALKEAVAMARKKAQVLADASQSTLGHVVKITEQGENQAVRYERAMGAVNALEAADQGAKLMPGEIAVEADVSVEFAIQ